MTDAHRVLLLQYFRDKGLPPQAKGSFEVFVAALFDWDIPRAKAALEENVREGLIVPPPGTGFSS